MVVRPALGPLRRWDPERIGPYVLLGRLGAGAMGQVFLGRSTAVQLTVTRGAVGTPAYMAPEQARDTRQASAASDVFSLGATLLYAATGHAPYQGETVMDVLVRLATEPPDMAGLPGDLTDLVTACLERSPRQRPTSATLLSQLGPYVEGGAAHNGHHAYLTDPAMALIGDYQHGPQLAAQAPAQDDAGDEATFASHTALSAPHAPATRRWLARRPTVLPGRPPSR